MIAAALLQGLGGMGVPAALAAEDPLVVKQQQDWQGRLDSMRALGEAYAREAARSGVDGRIVLDKVERTIGASRRLAAEGDYAQARRVADEGYRLLTAALAQMENARNLGGATASGAPPETDQWAAAARLRERINRQLQSTQALVDALQRQGRDKGVDQTQEIEAISALLVSSNDALAGGKLERAEQLGLDAYRRARAAIAGLQSPSDLKSGSAALEAEQKTGRPVDGTELRNVFTRREDSVATLLATGDRIAATYKSPSALLMQAEPLVIKARALAHARQYREAIALLDKAYMLIRKGIAEMRSGQQLIVDKTFATPDEEYRYEQELNDDYQRLIDMLLKSRRSAAWREMAERARRIGDVALDKARAGNWDGALSDIAASTLLLKQILKQAGFPIM